jgi:hypothetical protein
LYEEVVLTRTVAVFVFICVLGLGCSSSPAPRRAAVTTPTTTATTIARSRTCAVTRFGVGGAPNEIHVESAHGQLWGLALGPGHVPPRAGDEVKVVWRMTGTGPLRVVFRAPDGRAQPLVFGPEAHATSNYDRPGDEWGTGFRFRTAGCWHIHLARSDTSADIWLDVH